MFTGAPASDPYLYKTSSDGRIYIELYECRGSVHTIGIVDRNRDAVVVNGRAVMTST